MRKLCLGMLAGGLTLGSLCDAAPAQAIVFNFRFDGVSNGLPLEQPIVGTGTLSFDGNGSVGEFPLTSLPNYSFLINLGGATYTNANITTPVANVIARIVSSGSG